MTRITLGLSILALTSGCLRGTADRFTTQRVVPTAARIGDVDRVCRTGGALGNALAALPNRPPHEALVIADATAALCDEAAANEAALDALLAPRLAADPVAATKDARERERRLRARAAGRFASAWDHTQARFDIGETCPKIAPKDELTLLVGLLSGTLAMLHDKASGSTHEVPLDTLNRVGRVAPCLTGWWGTPTAFQAAAWAVVPGSGPADVDPWQVLRDTAASGDDTGVRLGWALLAVLADNAGRDDDVIFALNAAADSYEATPTDPEYALFDAYAHGLLQVQSDRRWIAREGYRVQGLRPPPDAPPPAPAGPASDPFLDEAPASDPFAEEAP